MYFDFDLLKVNKKNIINKEIIFKRNNHDFSSFLIVYFFFIYIYKEYILYILYIYIYICMFFIHICIAYIYNNFI